MSKPAHKIYEHLPDVVPVPVRLRNRRAEVVIVPLPDIKAHMGRRRKVLAAAWGSVKPARRTAQIDRDIAGLRAEWDHRP